MRVLVSGEGPSDLGCCTNAQGRCEGSDYKAGPMAVLLAQLAEPWLGYDLLHTPDSWQYVSETALSEETKAFPKRLQPTRGKKKGKETGYFHGNAYTLGRMALDLARQENEVVLAVLFRDSDGTRHSGPALWQDKWQSMYDGFASSGCTTAVPMLPKPKSEVWLICNALPRDGRDVAGLEDLPGNDVSPNSPKTQLSVLLGGRLSADELTEWLAERPFDAERAAALPSFKAFKHTLDEALQQVLRPPDSRDDEHDTQ